MTHRVVRDNADLGRLATFLSTLRLPLTVSWVQGEDRSSQQNRLMWQWAKDVAQQRGDTPSTEIQHDWKLRHGVPILRRDSEEFRAIYDAIIKPKPLDQKLRAMSIVSVTSDMTIKQMQEFLDTVQRECLEQGLRLTDPDGWDQYEPR